MHKEIDFNYITDGVYIGTNQCCDAHFDERLLKAEGITVDVSLEGERIDAPFGVEWYVWIPVEDKTAPTQDQLKFGVAALARSSELGKKIYLHCKNGHGRAPTLLAAYLIKKESKTPEQAFDFIRAKRPSIHLEKIQFSALAEFAQ